MRVIAYSTLRAFWVKHSDSETSLKAWFAKASKGEWTCMNDIISAIPSADPVGASHVVFNIAGNKYRLVCTTFFSGQMMWVKFIGTHAKYNNLDVKEL